MKKKIPLTEISIGLALGCVVLSALLKEYYATIVWFIVLIQNIRLLDLEEELEAVYKAYMENSNE